MRFVFRIWTLVLTGGAVWVAPALALPDPDDGPFELHWETAQRQPFAALRVSFLDLQEGGPACAFRFGVAGEGNPNGSVLEINVFEQDGSPRGMGAGTTQGIEWQAGEDVHAAEGPLALVREATGFKGGYAAVWDFTRDEFVAAEFRGRVSFAFLANTLAPEPPVPLGLAPHDPLLGESSAVLDLSCDGRPEILLEASREGIAIDQGDFDEATQAEAEGLGPSTSLVVGARSVRTFSAPAVEIVADEFRTGINPVHEGLFTVTSPQGAQTWDIVPAGIMHSAGPAGTYELDLDRRSVGPRASQFVAGAVGWTRVDSFDGLAGLPGFP